MEDEKLNKTEFISANFTTLHTEIISEIDPIHSIIIDRLDQYKDLRNKKLE